MEPTNETSDEDDQLINRMDKSLFHRFSSMLNEAEEQFSGVRKLPYFNRSHWEDYFQTTFDAYTKVWIFQQSHREVLQANNVGRHQIGEIASKIGQLYFHYYLRTSNIKYLKQSYGFYSAILERNYFAGVKGDSVRRYYARFTVVCLLYGKHSLIKKTLLVLLTNLVREDPHCPAEWHLAVQEIHLFLRACSFLQIKEGKRTVYPSRLNSLAFNSEDSIPSLQSAILIGNTKNQVKFSELTLDMYRMSLVLESLGGSIHNPTSELFSVKYLLYKPNIQKVLKYISSASQELENEKILMVYISDDGQTTEGITMVSNNESNTRNIECLYPEDISPFTRKPLFMVIDSYYSSNFLNIPNRFNTPLAVLCSPNKYPSDSPESSQIGSIFTYFLHEPIEAFCVMFGKRLVSSNQRNQCYDCLEAMYSELNNAIYTIDEPRLRFFLDDNILRLLIFHYIFYYSVMLLHISCDETYLPRSSPDLNILSNNTVLQTILSIAKILGIEHNFESI
eukprot:TRINITY_DN11716_c0_g1_i1.p1 TRINITY_DN11716_c0_g1~~TRINITY_DN11716_c0_g1_i1.p1  ORF type:complete len:506 (+),score=65.86 TRINITY_DN11716_c0_g1_i1:2-1519(+)